MIFVTTNLVLTLLINDNPDVLIAQLIVRLIHGKYEGKYARSFELAKKHEHITPKIPISSQLP